MDDRQLLEAAAKAAGIAVEWDGNARNLLRPVPFRNYVNYEVWNPLVDDGDALRLAVMLRLQVHIDDYGTAAQPTSELPQIWVGCEAGNLAGDHAAATRLAIVRAAAASAPRAARNGEG